jgi:hypothetical protein
MIFYIITAIFSFVFYYLLCFNSQNIINKIFYIGLYLLFAIILRFIIAPELNKDYYGYFDLHNFEDPEDAVSFLFSEPYLYILYKLLSFIIVSKDTILLFIYWFNFIITNAFFIWLATRLDLNVWRKMVLFVFYYFLFAFVLLRNGPVYILFACFFYYSYRNQKFNKILFTPFMHLSAISLIVTLFHNNKYYLKILFALLLLVLPVFIFYVLPLLNDLIALQSSMHKVDSYSEQTLNVSIFHIIYFFIISTILVLVILVYKKYAFHPILITTSLFYYIAFYVNPVLGFRFSPYFIMAVIFFFSDNTNKSKWNKYLDIVSFFMLPYFVFTLFETHTL